MVRTTITLPRSLKERMLKFEENWSELVRETIRLRIEEEGELYIAEAVILNELVKRTAPPKLEEFASDKAGAKEGKELLGMFPAGTVPLIQFEGSRSN